MEISLEELASQYPRAHAALPDGGTGGDPETCEQAWEAISPEGGTWPGG